MEEIFSEEGNLTDVLREDNYKNLISSANTLQEAINYIKKLYGTTEGIFTAKSFFNGMEEKRHWDKG